MNAQKGLIYVTLMQLASTQLDHSLALAILVILEMVCIAKVCSTSSYYFKCISVPIIEARGFVSSKLLCYFTSVPIFLV